MSKAAWRKLYAAFYPQTRSWLAARVGNESDADDLAEEVFAQLARGQAPADAKAYLDTVARNILSQHWRRKAKERAALRRLQAELAPGTGSSGPAGATEHSSKAPWDKGLEDLLDGLSAEDAELLRMKFRDGLSAEEISQRVGCSPPGVRQRLHRAIEKLREIHRVSGETPQGG